MEAGAAPEPVRPAWVEELCEALQAHLRVLQANPTQDP
jgi:hypothetical protein